MNMKTRNKKVYFLMYENGNFNKPVWLFISQYMKSLKSSIFFYSTS